MLEEYYTKKKLYGGWGLRGFGKRPHFSPIFDTLLLYNFKWGELKWTLLKINIGQHAFQFQFEIT